MGLKILFGIIVFASVNYAQADWVPTDFTCAVSENNASVGLWVYDEKVEMPRPSGHKFADFEKFQGMLVSGVFDKAGDMLYKFQFDDTKRSTIAEFRFEINSHFKSSQQGENMHFINPISGELVTLSCTMFGTKK